MEFTYLYSTTLITEMPNIINNNFGSVQRALDVFYDETNGIIISPINTPGRIKGASGEFVNLVVDNLTVKSQYTNIYENVTTANYDYWVAYTGIASPLRDPCIATSFWPSEDASFKYIDVQKPYYKIIPDVPVALNTDLKSQIVQLILDASGTIPGTYRILLDPSTSRYLDILVDASMVADGTETKWVSLFCVNYNASTGASWEIYEFGDAAAGSGSSGAGGGVTTVYVQNAIATAITPFTTNLTTIPTTYATNASLYTLFATNVSVGLAVGHYATNASVNSAFTLRDASISFLFSRNLFNEASIGTLTSKLNVVDTSLYTLTSRVNVIDTSISYIKAQYIPNVSLSNDFNWNGSGYLEVSMGAIAGLDLLASNASVNTAFRTNSSLGNTSQLVYALNTSIGAYATNASVNTALSNAFLTNSSLGNTSQLTYALNSSIGAYATNASVNTALSNAFLTNTSLGNVSQLVYALNASTGSGLGDYATNASVNTALSNAFLTNTSLGNTSQLTYALNSSIGAYATNASVNNTLANYTTYTYVDTSLNNLRAVPIKDSCLGGGLSWSAGVLYVDVSTIAGGVTLSYVDGSFGARDAIIVNLSSNASVNSAFLTNTSLGNTSQLTYALNSSIGAYATNASVNLSIANFATNASVNTGINNGLLINTSLGNTSQLTYALNTSIGAYATNASVNLSIANFATNVSVNTALSNAFLTNTSLGNISQLTYALNSSIGTYATNASVNTALSNAFLTNTSLGDISQLTYALNSSIGAYATNASVNLSIANFATNVSVNTALSNALITNTSLGDISQLTYALNSSIGEYATNASVNLSIADFATNASVNLSIADFATNVSVNVTFAKFVPSASLGTTLYWAAGILNVSTGTGYTTFGYVDGSLLNHQNQINSLSSRITTLETSTGNATYAYVDGSLAKRDASINYLLSKDIIFNASIGWLDASLKQIYPLVFKINSSLGIYATNASVNNAFASNASIGRIDTSLRTIYPLVFKTNSSLGNLTQTKFDACIGYLTGRINVVDNSTFYWKLYVDGSLSIISGNISTLNSQVSTINSNISALTSRHNATESSLSYVTPLIYANNTSINYIQARYIPEVSLNHTYFKWISGLLEPSIASVTSLAALTDTSIKALVNNDYLKYDSSWGKWVNQSPVDASTTLLLRVLYDVSIVDVSNNDYLRYNYTLGKWVNERTLEASLYYYTKTQVDSSFALKADVDASLNNVALLWSYVNSSSYVDGSLNLIWTYLNDYVEASTMLVNYISDASLNQSKFKWLSGKLEPSIAGVSSLATLTDVSIKDVSNNDLLKYDSSFGKWMNIAPVDSSIYFYTKTQVDASFALKSAVNASIGAINASLNSTFLLSSYVNTSSYYDGSLNNIRGLYATNASVNTAFITNTSLGTLSILVNAINTSLNNYIDISSLFYTMAQVDASFALKSAVNASFGAINASLNDALLLSSYVNTSSYYDGSLNNIRGLYATNASVNTAFITNVSLGLAFNQYANASLGITQLSLLTDVSIVSIANNNYLRYDSCTGKWKNTQSEDASVYFYTKSEIDASFVRISSKTFQVLTISASTATWNMNSGYNAILTLTQDASLNITNIASGDSGTLIVKQDVSGNRLLGLPLGSFKNNAWILSNASYAKDIISFLYDGSDYYWNKGGPYA